MSSPVISSTSCKMCACTCSRYHQSNIAPLLRCRELQISQMSCAIVYAKLIGEYSPSIQPSSPFGPYQRNDMGRRKAERQVHTHSAADRKRRRRSDCDQAAAASRGTEIGALHSCTCPVVNPSHSHYCWIRAHDDCGKNIVSTPPC